MVNSIMVIRQCLEWLVLNYFVVRIVEVSKCGEAMQAFMGEPRSQLYGVSW